MRMNDRSSGLRMGLSRFMAVTAVCMIFHSVASAQAAPALEYYKLVPGFLPESKNASGRATGNGFATANPWGAYTAYLMATNAKGQRTWRVEDYLPMGNGAQGSSMYLLEGSERALLIDTAQNTADVPGQNDLKTVLRYLLGHNNDGSVRSKPVDFVVCNTHFHGDHTGKNNLMSDRTLYYPDLDWPASAPANWVPIREGGGPTTHGSGTAVGEIVLGERTIRAIRLYGHTPGSTAYLDADNNLIATGDAIGSGYVWMHFGLISLYADSVRHLRDVLRPMNNPAILPAHFYQVDTAVRGAFRGKPLDKQYVDDEVAAATGVLNGTIVGEPYAVGRQIAVAKVNSGQMTFSLNKIFAPSEGVGTYHAVAIPGETSLFDTTFPARFAMVSNIKTRFYLIREIPDYSMYLIVGSEKALLVGTGSGAPGLASFVARLTGGVPVEVIVTSDDPGQIGGLAQFSGDKLYVPKGATRPGHGHKHVTEVGQGDTISLGTDRAGRPVTVAVEPLEGHSRTGLTLVDVNDRVLLSGDALGMQAADGGLILNESLADFSAALKAWRARTDGKYDVVYTARNFQWFTLPAFVDQVQAAVAKGMSGADAAREDSTAVPGAKVIKSTGAADVVASIVLAGAK